MIREGEITKASKGYTAR
jgi:predicted enzyme related to lactoylglutathione lyase